MGMMLACGAVFVDMGRQYTVRPDIGRLRELGYSVDASPGPGGGYRLGAGSVTPPLLLDDDEAVAMALGAAASSLANTEDIALQCGWSSSRCRSIS